MNPCNARLETRSKSDQAGRCHESLPATASDHGDIGEGAAEGCDARDIVALPAAPGVRAVTPCPQKQMGGVLAPPIAYASLQVDLGVVPLQQVVAHPEALTARRTIEVRTALGLT